MFKNFNSSLNLMLGYNQSLQDTLRLLLDPLLKKLGFNYFYFARHYKKEKFFSLSTSPVIDEIFKRNFLNHACVFHIPLNPQEKKVSFWDMRETNPSFELIKSYNHMHGVSILYHQGDYIDGWFFATDKNQECINILYNNHFDLIEKAIVYFISKAEHFLKIEENAAFWPDNSLSRLSWSNPQKEDDFWEGSLDLKKIPFKIKEKDIFFTKKEFHLIQLLSKGLSMKELAETLSKSPRTIESQLTKIKNKADISSKTHLIDLFNNSIYKKFNIL